MHAKVFSYNYLVDSVLSLFWIAVLGVGCIGVGEFGGQLVTTYKYTNVQDLWAFFHQTSHTEEQYPEALLFWTKNQLS